MKKLFFLSAVTLLLAGCVKDDVNNYGITDVPTYEGIPGGFDYSTTNEVNLTVDYSACNTSAPVFFRVFSEDPFNGEELNPNVKPIYSNFTDGEGHFSEKIDLPSYATDLYVFTGDFFVDDQLINVKVVNNAAEAVAGTSRGSQRANARRRAYSQGSGVLTNSLENLYQLTNTVNWRTGEKEENQIYNEWKTWLGKWDSRTGRPDYLLKEGDDNYAALTFSEEEMQGIRQSIAAAVVRKEVCPEEYRMSADLTLKEAAAVSVTMVGSNTCWNDCLGYYYYQGEAPTNLKDIHVIMLFPNTQDGHSQLINQKYKSNYNGNIALDRGDAVQLIYYRHIAEGSEEDPSYIFPKGTKIGFLLKSNGWGMQKTQGNTKYHNAYSQSYKSGTGMDSKLPRQYNCWSASTDGLSYCEENKEQNTVDDGSVSNPNPERKSRTSKFAYEKDGQQYAIVAFEDASNDEDYGDVILALKPVGLFQELPVPTSREESTWGVYAYEDLWPSKGDYDMNDAVVEVKEDRVITMFKYKNQTYMTKQTFNLTTYQNHVDLTSGLAFTLQTNSNAVPTSIAMKKIPSGSTEAVETNFEIDGNVYKLTDDIKNEINTTYIIELTYEGGVKTSNAAKIKPFIYRNETNNKRWEVHIPMEAPTSKMNTSYFGKQDDKSDLENKIYYVRDGNYPFAFYLSGVSIDSFKDNILKRENEKKPIDQLFPKFIGWSTSNGKENTDWYKPVKQ